MSWVKIDDAFDEHPKIVGLSPQAVTLHIRALCWCSRHLTDGVVPDGAIARLAWGLHDPSLEPRSTAVELERNGLWERDGSGGTSWVIHDYLKYNPDRTTVERERERARRQRVQAGVKSGLARRTKRERNSERNANEKPTGMERNANPDPHPLPVPHKDQDQHHARAKEQAGTSKPGRCLDCDHILAEFNRLSGRKYTGAGRALGFIHQRHQEHGVETCLRVAAARIEECLRRPETWKWANPETIFRPANFERALNESLHPPDDAGLETIEELVARMNEEPLDGA